MKAMNALEVPDDQSSKGVSLPRWMVPIFWMVGLLIVVGITGVVWTMALHFVRAPARVEWERTPGYLLIRGPYHFTRNPMYLAELALWLGWALFYGSFAVFIGFLLLCVMMNFIAVPREERALEARFGEAFREYKHSVPRWLGKAVTCRH